jgi:hypothetical protein
MIKDKKCSSWKNNRRKMADSVRIKIRDGTRGVSRNPTQQPFSSKGRDVEREKYTKNPLLLKRQPSENCTFLHIRKLGTEGVQKLTQWPVSPESAV